MKHDIKKGCVTVAQELPGTDPSGSPRYPQVFPGGGGTGEQAAQVPTEIGGERGRGGSGAERASSRRRTLNKCVPPSITPSRCHHLAARARRGTTTAVTATTRHPPLVSHRASDSGSVRVKGRARVGGCAV